MERAERYGIKSLERDFPDDDTCLAFIFDALHSRQCSCGGTYSRLKGRRQFQCSKCRFQIAPTAGTIFEKSDTPLTLWFKAVLAFSNAKSGVSAKYMERELEVTYKTAWRILKQIRTALGQQGKLKGDVEMDSAYLGGVHRSGRNNKYQREAMAAKSVVMGAVERKGQVRAKVVKDNTALAHARFLRRYVAKKDTRLMTDNANRLELAASGYERQVVDHHLGERVRDDVHVNTIEAFWSHVKRSIRGTYKVVSRKHLQSYLDAFVFHYNNRHSDKLRFSVLLGRLLRGAG